MDQDFFAYACAKGRLNLLTSCFVLTFDLVQEKNEKKKGKKKSNLGFEKRNRKKKQNSPNTCSIALSA